MRDEWSYRLELASNGERPPNSIARFWVTYLKKNLRVKSPIRSSYPEYPGTFEISIAIITIIVLILFRLFCYWLTSTYG